MGRLLEFIFKKKREDFQRLTEERYGNFKFPDNVVRIKDIGYDKKYPERKLDVYRPDDTSRKYPVIVNVHGGGLVMGNQEFNTYFCAQLAKLGFIVFSVEYRLIPQTKIYGSGTMCHEPWTSLRILLRLSMVICPMCTWSATAQALC